MSRPAAALALSAVTFVAACTPAADEPRTPPHETLPGKWGWQGSTDCADAPVEISFSTDRKTMRLSHAPADDTGKREPRRDAVYFVIGENKNGLSLAMQGEDRTDAAGKLVTWNLIMLSRGEYCWQRSDWPRSGCTKSVHRCGI